MDVVIKWPGSVHNALIFSKSKIHSHLGEERTPSLRKVVHPVLSIVRSCIPPYALPDERIC